MCLYTGSGTGTGMVTDARRAIRHQVNFTSDSSKTYGNTVSLTKRGKPHRHAKRRRRPFKVNFMARVNFTSCDNLYGAGGKSKFYGCGAG